MPFYKCLIKVIGACIKDDKGNICNGFFATRIIQCESNNEIYEECEKLILYELQDLRFIVNKQGIRLEIDEIEICNKDTPFDKTYIWYCENGNIDAALKIVKY